jgi:hypothetical protein
MWIFRGSNEDSDFESDNYDSDEYETDSEQELDSDEEKNDHNVEEKYLPPERVETEDDLPKEDEETGEENDSYEKDLFKQDQEEETPDSAQESGTDKEKESVVTAQQANETPTTAKEKEAPTTLEIEESREEDSASEEEEEETSLAEKRALVALAAENDRVDILKAILTDQDKSLLLEADMPPLHVAISYGSTNATSCLLRMGANPAVRPTSNQKYAGMTAWELAFGCCDNSSIKPVEMPPSKREGIRHAFTAEALRCIGGDEVERLQHLLDSGMPPSIDIGGKNLYGWSIEMGANQCKKLTLPFEPNDKEEHVGTEDKEEEQQKPSAIVSHHDSDSLLNLDNRLEELESLSKALSSLLDNLAEEVSVCHGLLLLGGGASALASHVRSLKVLKERRETELERCLVEWNDSQDELAYWFLQNGGKDGFNIPMAGETNNYRRKRSFTTPENDQDEEAQRRQLKAQIAASENKVRKLRSSIADLSEENARDLLEVEKRGLSGGIKLVRSLREEIREVEFRLSEAKSGTVASRTCISLIVTRFEANKKMSYKPRGAYGDTESSTMNRNQPELVTSMFEDGPSESEKIASGDSDAIALRAPGNRGYLPIDLWDIILRIIGLGRVAVKKSVRENTPSAMII